MTYAAVDRKKKPLERDVGLYPRTSMAVFDADSQLCVFGDFLLWAHVRHCDCFPGFQSGAGHFWQQLDWRAKFCRFVFVPPVYARIPQFGGVFAFAHRLGLSGADFAGAAAQ